MRRIIALLLAIVLLHISTAHASVHITEINWMGSVDSQFAEWFELYNDSTESVNLAGWKLYEDGGAQLDFTLTKSIDAKGYLLVERTTGTSPDPVPGINDEAGSFGGSGFSNTGENLVLKDAQGLTIQSLSYASGWPAGDSTTKQTMQWDGATWVTAPATPKAALSGTTADIPPSVPAGGGGSAWSMPKIVPHVALSFPETVYATVAAEYSAAAFLEYDKAYSGLFLWNMGDGTTHRYNTPTTVVHTYQYPGTYTVSFAYYKNPYDAKPFLFESTEVSVGNPTVALAIVPGKGFQFTNSDTVPVDISGWIIVLSDTSVILPAFTIIAPKKTVLMPFSSFGLLGAYTTAQLQTPERVSIGTSSKNKEALPIVSQHVPSLVVSKESASTSMLAASAIDAVPAVDTKSTTKHSQKVSIVAIALCVVVGLFVFVEKIIASREE